MLAAITEELLLLYFITNVQTSINYLFY